MKQYIFLFATVTLCSWAGSDLGARSLWAAPPPVSTDWSDWEKHRGSVVHPATILKPQDLARAKENINRYAWARDEADRIRRAADEALKTITPEYVEKMIEDTTPGCTGPCPACRAKGIAWHPGGQWRWSPSSPDELTCAVCETVFPNEEFPETVVVESTWGRGQKFTFMGGETFKVFSYTEARPSLSGITRARKVSYMTRLLETLGTAHALTDDPRYARGAKAILSRFADVFPEYLVFAGYGYGEYAGMDPHVAAERINELPEDERVYPPNKPNRKLHTGYWSASRIGTSGMDGGWVVSIAVAYDLTCMAEENGEPVYSEDEKLRIERDLLLESAYLALCDPDINNKSVGNRAGVAVVGICVGHPGLVRFGVEGFQEAVNNWFLPDGGTSESPAYAIMTMSGLRPFVLALRNYSDPAGYIGADGFRFDDFEAGRGSKFGDCWQALIWTLQGDLRFPPSADSYRSTSIGPRFAELIAVAYPTEEHIALLKETTGEIPSRGAARDALFYREPGLEQREAPPLRLPDMVFPFLAQGYARTGETGRGGLLMLNASDWGGHHHRDSLNLYLWQDGHELLTDLGYLWDHPDKSQTARTFAHNLVMIDGRDQQTTGRGGSFEVFATTSRVKVMRASSDAYGPKSLYQRTSALVDHGPAGSYVLDIFEAGGGATRDYVFHGPGNEYRVESLSLAPAPPDSALRSLPLEKLETAAGESPWSIRWTLPDGYEFRALSPGLPGETVALGQGWGQRDHTNEDRGATLPYVVRRRVGEGEISTFVTIFEGSAANKRLVKAVRLMPVRGGYASAVEVDTTDGKDLIVNRTSLNSERVTASFDGEEVATDGRFAAIISQGGKPSWATVVGGEGLDAPGISLKSPVAAFGGKIVEVGGERDDSYFVVDAELPKDRRLDGQTFFAIDQGVRRAYPIVGVEAVEGRTRVFTKRDGRGFVAHSAPTWEIPVMLEQGVSE